MRVFISYADKERDLARELAHRLAGAGLQVWSADEEIGAGENWAAATQRALDESNALVILLSPDALRSRWVRREIDYALGSPRFEGRVVPVQVRPTRDKPWILDSFPCVRASKDLDQVARDIVSALAPEPRDTSARADVRPPAQRASAIPCRPAVAGGNPLRVRRAPRAVRASRQVRQAPRRGRGSP
jgi:hypothetical protein